MRKYISVILGCLYISSLTAMNVHYNLGAGSGGGGGGWGGNINGYSQQYLDAQRRKWEAQGRRAPKKTPSTRLTPAQIAEQERIARLAQYQAKVPELTETAHNLGKSLAAKLQLQNNKRDDLARVAQNKALACSIQTSLSSQLNQVKQSLNNSEIGHLLRDEINFAQKLCDNLPALAQEGISDCGLKLITDFAQDLPRSAGLLLAGAAHGVNTSFKNTTDLIVAVYEDPTIVAHMAANIKNMITHPQIFIDLVSERYEAVIEVLTTGDIYSQGTMFGEFAGNIMQAMAGLEAGALGKEYLSKCASKFAAIKPQKLGQKIFEEIDKHPLIDLETKTAKAEVRVNIAETTAQAEIDTILRNGGTMAIWENIIPTQPFWPSTALPKSFIVSIDTHEIWVGANATEHLKEWLAHPTNYVHNAAKITILAHEVILGEFRQSLGMALKQGITYGEKMNIKEWTFVFTEPKFIGGKPQLIHLEHSSWKK